jgi:predicted ATPase/Tfp pilus assembly protein PilF
LGSVTQVDLLPTAISEALEFSFFGTDPLAEQLLRLVEEKHMLWVLDNLEQLLPLPPNNLISQILQLAPGITILATSRQRLNLQEEYVFSVEGLSYPANASALELEQQDAIQLFVNRSQHIRPHFSLAVETDRQAVVEICQFLEGLPLGVELAAAALWMHTPAEIAANLKGNLRTLASASINAEERHRSLWAAFEVSWALLTPEDQQLMARLSVFRRGFEAEMVQATWQASMGQLAALLDKSLLRRRPSGRYEIHEAIRQFAAEKLALDADQSNVALAAHAQNFAIFLQARLEPLKSTGQLQALAEIAQEWENIRQAWVWLISERDAAALAVCAEAMFHFCTIRTRYREGIELYARAIDKLDDTPEIQARLLTYQGALALYIQENDLCEQALGRALTCFASCEIPNIQALCLDCASELAFRRKNPALARQRCEQSLALFTQTGDAWGQSCAFYRLGLLESRAGHVLESQQAILNSLQIARTIGDPHRQIGPLNKLGDLACQLGQYAESLIYFEEALVLSRTLGDRFNISQALINLGTVFHLDEQYDQARKYYTESLSISLEIGDLANQSLALANLGELALANRQFTESIAALQQGLALAKKAGDEWAELVCWLNLCEVAVEQNNIPLARQYLKKTLPLAEKSGEPALLLRTLLQLGRLYLLQDETERAVKLLGLVIHHEASYDEHRQAAQEVLMQAGLPMSTAPEVLLELEMVVKIEINSGVFD